MSSVVDNEVLYGVKSELKNYDNLPEIVKKNNSRYHIDHVSHNKGACTRVANNRRALGNEKWNITVVRVVSRKFLYNNGMGIGSGFFDMNDPITEIKYVD